MSVQNYWTRERLDVCVNVLATYAQICPNALQEISDRLQREVRYDALCNAFRRNGMRAPGAYCQGLPFEPEALEWECDVGDLDEGQKHPSSEDVALERVLIVPDCHHPYVDATAWKTLLAVGREFRPRRIIVLGDFGDFYCISRHRKDPNRNRHLEKEVAAGNAALNELESLGADTHDFIQGNHEESLERYLIDHAPELFNMITTRGLYELDRRGWSYTPFKHYLKVGRIHYTHCVESAGGKAHEQAEADLQSNVVIGHTHRACATYSGNVLGDRHVAISSGWLGDVAMAEYLHNAKKTRHWQHAFTAGWMERDGTTHLQLIPIVEGKACLNGDIVRAA